MAEDPGSWVPVQKPKRQTMEGRFVRLEPLDSTRHTHELFLASAVADGEERFRYLPEYCPQDEADFKPWVEQMEQSEDPLFFAVLDKATGRVAGRQTLMRIDTANGCIEIGNIYWGPLISRTPAATEALFLFMQYIFDDLGYRRFEWKCNNDNEPSKKAALRFGFQHEGLFRQHMIVKGLNRDTAWYAMIDKDWPTLKKAYLQWLTPENFTPDGQQIQPLAQLIHLAQA